jgi:hypothetical protein
MLSLRVAKIFSLGDREKYKKKEKISRASAYLGVSRRDALNQHGATKSATAESVQRASVLSGASNDPEEPSAPGAG